MNINEKTNLNNKDSLLADVGENYHYLKTIVSNKVEITKLEFLQKIAGMGSLILFSIIGLFTMVTIFVLFVAALVVYFANVYGSYLYALLMVNAIIIVFSILAFFFVKPRITSMLEKRMFTIINEK